MFSILYNCMTSVFLCGESDAYILKCHWNDVCERYIVISMIKIGIFGNDKKSLVYLLLVSFIIRNVFDSDSISFKKPSKSCVPDIKYKNDAG